MAEADGETGAPAPDEASRKVPKPSGVALEAVGLSLSQRIEVLWEVELTDGTEESVWWGAVVEAPSAADEEAPGQGAAQLVYEAQHGFEKESRRVVFTEGSFLWDAALRERLPYRREGEPGPVLHEEEAEGEEADGEEADGEGAEGALAVGAAVKARFQGGERECAGVIHEAHADGTYDVLYPADGTLEQNVPREMITVVEASAAESEEPMAANSVNEFFEMFVSALTSGPMFARLTPEQRATASEKVRLMRPHFEAELTSLKEARGWGAVVSGEDIKAMMPNVMKRAKEAAA